MRPALLALIPLVFAPSLTGAQTCVAPHYRWDQKTDTTFAPDSATSADVSDLLGWAPRSITRADKCAARVGREKTAYEVTAWVRRIRLHETDGDWHIEITEEEDSPVAATCVIAEISDPQYGGIYARARRDLAALVDTTSLSHAGDLPAAVQVTFVGTAFFDGYHQKHLPNGKAQAVQHGRCNSSVSALWELHPVYKVKAPAQP
jgi:hypothetical protein